MNVKVLVHLYKMGVLSIKNRHFVL